MRQLEYELTLFGGAREHVQVTADCRAFGFTIAALQATDPNDVWKVRLIRDSGRYMSPEDEDLVDPDTDIWVPNEERSPRGYDLGKRGYHIYFEFFTTAIDDEDVLVSGRPNAFAAGAIASEYPDDVMEVYIESILEDTAVDGEWRIHRVNRNRKYGGVTLDLQDPFIPVRLH